MRIVVDAMGSDTFPAPDVAGSVLAAREWHEPIILVGDKAKIQQELAKHDTAGLPIEIVHAEQTVTMDDKPGEVVKSKPNSSMHVGLALVKAGQADAFVTAGNTGAAMGIAITKIKGIGRIEGVDRPALVAIAPFGDQRTVLLDVGANADAKPEWLAQFALMGSIYAEKALGRVNPRVALLSNGEEETKGSELVKLATELVQKLPINYIGHVEPKEVLMGHADVVVADGFAGNILIKTAEGALTFLADLIRNEIKSKVLWSAGGLLVRPAFRRVYAKLDPREIGGAPLLGVNGVVIIGHGRSDASAIKNAVRQARAAVSGNVVEAIRVGLEAISS
jgi:phosphate acyltransferase